MKRFFRRLILKAKISRTAAHLGAIQAQREMLNRTETFCMRELNRLHLETMNLDIKARRHA
jgi:hypothetical protein